jgi:hypothetical protein
MTHLLVISQRYYKMLGPTIKIKMTLQLLWRVILDNINVAAASVSC